MCAGMFLVLLDVTIVNIALPSVGARMGGGQVADLQWVVDGYQLTLAGLLLAGTPAVISRLHPDRESRARVIGAWAAIGSLALPTGPLLGGRSSSSSAGPGCSGSTCRRSR
ncbi:hypothetical protein [Nonomuraea montanisoli]|uniref:hypothetical protein n=1 Tax=Nonomuraea montanisoli TaxID=2741721 RepID=UPI00196357CF|nr:hypothetical protein [Nonomuraea montanisoli]